MTTIDGGLGVLIKGNGALFWTLLVSAAVLLVAWVVVVVIAYANKKAFRQYIRGVGPWRSERPWDGKLEVLQLKVEELFGMLGLLLAFAGEVKAAATEKRDHATCITVNNIAHDMTSIAVQLMSAMATRWMALATMLFSVPLIYVAGLFSTQGHYAVLMISMVASFVLVIGLGYFAWDMQQYITHYSNVDQLITYLTLTGSNSTKTSESCTSGSKAARIDMNELGDCDAQRKNAVTRMLETLGYIEENALLSRTQARVAVLLSLVTLVCAFFVSEAYVSPAQLVVNCWGALTVAAIIYGISSRHLSTFHKLLRLMQQKAFEEVCRKHSYIDDVQKKVLLVVVHQALLDKLRQSTTEHFLAVIVE